MGSEQQVFTLEAKVSLCLNRAEYDAFEEEVLTQEEFLDDLVARGLLAWRADRENKRLVEKILARLEERV